MVWGKGLKGSVCKCLLCPTLSLSFSFSVQIEGVKLSGHPVYIHWSWRYCIGHSGRVWLWADWESDLEGRDRGIRFKDYVKKPWPRVHLGSCKDLKR